MDNKIYSRIEQLTPAVLTELLTRSGAIQKSRVKSLSSKPIGNGLVGDSVRFKLEYDNAEPSAPTSLVAKLPSTDKHSRETGIERSLYLKELMFYREIASTVDVRVPSIYCADIDFRTHEFCLLMEDIRGASSGDQLAGCTPEQAFSVLQQAAALHAPRWGDENLKSQQWLDRQRYIPTYIEVFPSLFAAFRERYDGLVNERHLEIGENLSSRIADYYELHSQPWTIQHGDFRLDNLLFGPPGSDSEVVVLDWQTAMLGPGTCDVAYFLGAGLLTEQRRNHEEELLRGYLDGLHRRGVRNYDWNQCWRDYRLFAIQGYIMATTASMVVERTPRGDEMFLTMARRHGEQILDLNSLALIG